MIITICSSIDFTPEILKIKNELEKKDTLLIFHILLKK